MVDVNPTASAAAAFSSGVSVQQAASREARDSEERNGLGRSSVENQPVSPGGESPQRNDLNPRTSTVNVSQEAQFRLAADGTQDAFPAASTESPAGRLAQQFNDLLGESNVGTTTASTVEAPREPAPELTATVAAASRSPSGESPDRTSAVERSTDANRAQAPASDPSRSVNDSDLTR